MRPICIRCKRFFHPKKNGFAFLEGMPISTDALPGKEESEKWKPYKLWMGDLWDCPSCGAEIIVGVGSNRIAEHYESNFDSQIKAWGADQFQVNDCG